MNAQPETRETVADFIARNQIATTAERISRRPDVTDNEWAASASHWLVTLRFEGKGIDRKLSTFYSMGSAHKGRPDAASVLDSLRLDAQSVGLSTFEDWCGDCGYDTDSRKAEAIYHACQDGRAKLVAFLGRDLYAQLLECEPL